MSFVHLHLHTEYSLVDGLVKIPRLAARSAIMELPAIAVTEQGNTFSAIKFYRALQSHGIKPIIGAELNMIDPASKEGSSIVLLCQHIEGFRNLSRLISKSYKQGQHRGVPFIENLGKRCYEKILTLFHVLQKSGCSFFLTGFTSSYKGPVTRCNRNT